MTNTRLTLLLVALGLWATPASAQTLGTFRWNTAPYCNVVFLTVTQVGSFYRLEGYDEQCGGNPRQPLWGIGVVQPNGSITFGLSQVMLPGFVKPVAIRASLSLPALNGSWEDNAGSSGTFVFNPGAVTGGPRTVPVVFDPASDAAAGDHTTVSALQAEVAELRRLIEALAKPNR